MVVKSRAVLSWCLFDFANSSYSAVIAAVIFPVYFSHVIVGNTSGQGDLWWGKAISCSMAIVALSSPFIGGIADRTGLKKHLLVLYTYLCITATASLALLQPGMILGAFVLVVLANTGLEGGIVFYNSFLADITDRRHQGRVSAWGFGAGYLGSILALFVALALLRQSLTNAIWPATALFFALFSAPAILYLPRSTGQSVPLTEAAIGGFRHTVAMIRTVLAIPDQRRFLAAYFLYEDGVNTVIVFSSLFAATTLGFSSAELVGVYILVQATALTGAFLMARPIDLWGPRKVVILSLILWSSVAVAAYMTATKLQFFMVAGVAGLGLGTVQAASRAFFAQYIPEGREAEYFGAYNLVGKSSAIFGPLLFGYISSVAGSQRPAVLSVAALFIAGLLILSRVRGGQPNDDGKERAPEMSSNRPA